MGAEESKQFSSGSHPARTESTRSPHGQPVLGQLGLIQSFSGAERGGSGPQSKCEQPAPVLLSPQRLADTWARDAQQERVMTVTRPGVGS